MAFAISSTHTHTYIHRPALIELKFFAVPVRKKSADKRCEVGATVGLFSRRKRRVDYIRTGIKIYLR